MASSATVQQLIDYYTNLLIIQYNNQPNAHATIALFTQALLANGVYLDVLNGYNIQGDNIAVGTQLDVIGKYLGVNRFFTEFNLDNYTGLVTYSEHSSLPSSPPVFGLSVYANFSGFSYNGTLTYADIIAPDYITLTDDAFLIIIQFAIICNNINFSSGAIDAALYKFFGMAIRAEYPAAMEMVFFVSSPISEVLQAVINKKLLPIPMAVGGLIVSNISGEMFGLTDYLDVSRIPPVYSAFAYGMCTYSTFAATAGQILQYNQITLAN